jgi:predicted esterase
MKKIIWEIILLFLSQNIVYSQNNLSANSAECLNDKITRITGKNECLAIHTFVKNSETKIKNLVIFIHGDQSDNGPVSGMINNTQGTPVPNGTVKVAILRPGYFDKAGNKSTGNDCGRRDCYTVTNLDEMTAAVQSLKNHYKPTKTILIGHSGGAATSGVMIGRTPGIAEGAILLACPCSISQWRFMQGRSGSYNSLSPSDFIKNIPKTTKIFAITGASDTNTQDVLARDYVKSLTDLNIYAKYKSLPNVDHNKANEIYVIEEALNELLK